MSRTVGWALLAMGLGVWAGVFAWPSDATNRLMQTGLAIVIGFNMIFSAWVWHRAPRGSGDARVMPFVVILSASMLCGLVPRVAWPESPSLHLAGSIASLAGPAMALAYWVRRRRGSRA